MASIQEAIAKGLAEGLDPPGHDLIERQGLAGAVDRHFDQQGFPPSLELLCPLCQRPIHRDQTVLNSLKQACLLGFNLGQLALEGNLLLIRLLGILALALFKRGNDCLQTLNRQNLPGQGFEHHLIQLINRNCDRGA
ncbi:MAG: hypothetical protein OEL53_02450 [Rhodospirillales bacterium]|nr:hypothetical protein [Rhodospirillales bacterium]